VAPKMEIRNMGDPSHRELLASFHSDAEAPAFSSGCLRRPTIKPRTLRSLGRLIDHRLGELGQSLVGGFLSRRALLRATRPLGPGREARLIWPAL
jgi:hypothetical protein